MSRSTKELRKWDDGLCPRGTCLGRSLGTGVNRVEVPLCIYTGAIDGCNPSKSGLGSFPAEAVALKYRSRQPKRKQSIVRRGRGVPRTGRGMVLPSRPAKQDCSSYGSLKTRSQSGSSRMGTGPKSMAVFSHTYHICMLIPGRISEENCAAKPSIYTWINVTMFIFSKLGAISR